MLISEQQGATEESLGRILLGWQLTASAMDCTFIQYIRILSYHARYLAAECSYVYIHAQYVVAISLDLS